MAGNAIEVEHLSKRYRLGEDMPGRSLRESLGQSVRRLARRAGPPDEIWSLRDVSFTVTVGAALGVIGRNGAGKSTLLKILSRITEPTSGVSRTRGRVATLLEVGTGFHQELTGRENVFLNAAILGMGRRDIRRRFDEIIDFAGLERFVDTPVKRYSSGMYLRLAFAVAAHLEPDVMVVDEVLAVGDAEFQRKCLGKMSAAEREGRTVVFVSHDLEAISRLCPESIWLDQGSIKLRGPTGEVVDSYLTSGLVAEPRAGFADDPSLPIVLRRVSAVDAVGRTSEVLRRDQPFAVEVAFSVRTRVPGLDVAVYLENLRGVRAIDETWSDTSDERPDEPGEYVLRLEVPPVLNVGDYAIGVWIGSAYEELLSEPAAGRFRLEGAVKDRPDRIVELRLPWTVCEAPTGADLPTR